MLQGFLQTFLTLLIVFLLAPIVGRYLFHIFTDHKTILERLLDPVERQIYQLSGVDSEETMSGQEYAIAVVVSNTAAGPIVLLTLENLGISQAIARGSIAHFEIIKMLGENGGAFFGGNSAHPFQNPNGGSQFLQVLAMLLFPTTLLYTYGYFIVRTDRRSLSVSARRLGFGI